MSRVGKQILELPKDVKVKVEGDLCLVEGKGGKLDLNIPANIKVEIKDSILTVTRDNDLKLSRSLHGTIRVLIGNMVKGVTEGYKKELEIIGVGYKAQMKGNKLALNVGFSHPVERDVPEGLKVSTPAATRILIEGIDKQKVGEFAAKIRKIYPPEPYKGKGIRYLGEEVRKKLGKALAK
ncbi:MAG: 50S ribosomal protein L6 [Candidatus Omnitrophica bacterium]|nr:50S ribosomal protein L6 [Candidatus Omnitrophota bacterium]